MFAPPIKAPKAKTASQTTPTRAPKPPQRTPLRPGAGLSNQALLRLLQSEAQRAESLTGSTSADHQTQEADRGRIASSEAAPSASWDFSKIPVFAPDRLSGPEARSPLLQPKLTIGEVNNPLEHEADRVADQVMRMPEPTLQRKCACGGACPQCKSDQHRTLQMKRMDSSVLGSAANGLSSGTKQDVTPFLNPSAGAPIRKASYENSGTCTVETSESNCFPDAGGYIIGPINNNCVTRPCTIEHELVHVRELNECCRAYSQALKKPGANGLAITQAWLAWKEQARPITECHAYMNDVSCAQRLAQSKGCVPQSSETENPNRVASGEAAETVGGAETEYEDFAQEVTLSDTKPLQGVKGLSADCIDITWYQQYFGDRAAEKCDEAAGKAFPPCPSFKFQASKGGNRSGP